MWNVEIPEYASDVKDCPTGIACSHELGLSTGARYGWLETAFVGYRAPCKTDTDATKRASCFGAGSPIRVGIRVCDKRWEFGSAVKAEVGYRTIDDWEWTVGKFQMWGRTPEVEAILAGVVKELQCVFESVVVVLGGAGV